MTVCDIRGEDGHIYINSVEVDSIEEAYKTFRELYNKALGKANHLKLGHRGERTSRLTKPGIVFSEDYKRWLQARYSDVPRVRCYLMGILGPAYCKIVGCHDFVFGYSDYSEEEADTYLDWVFCKGSNMLRQYGRRELKQRPHIKHNR